MSESMVVRLYNPQQAWQLVGTVWQWCKAMLIAGHTLNLEVRKETRSNAQNRLMWGMLTDVSEQVEWHGRFLSPTDWKHIFTSSLKKMDVVPNLDGTGFVVLGLATSRMNKKEINDLVELMFAFGSEKSINWTYSNDQ